MAVADLGEAETAFGQRHRPRLTEGLRAQDAAADAVKDTGPDPGHALEEAPAIDAVVVVVINDFVCHMLSSFLSGECCVPTHSTDADWNRGGIFPEKW